MLQGSTFSLECAAFPRIFYPAIDIPHAGCAYTTLAVSEDYAVCSADDPVASCLGILLVPGSLLGFTGSPF